MEEYINFEWCHHNYMEIYIEECCESSNYFPPLFNKLFRDLFFDKDEIMLITDMDEVYKTDAILGEIERLYIKIKQNIQLRKGYNMCGRYDIKIPIKFVFWFKDESLFENVMIKSFIRMLKTEQQSVCVVRFVHKTTLPLNINVIVDTDRKVSFYNEFSSLELLWLELSHNRMPNWKPHKRHYANTLEYLQTFGDQSLTTFKWLETFMKCKGDEITIISTDHLQYILNNYPDYFPVRSINSYPFPGALKMIYYHYPAQTMDYLLNEFMDYCGEERTWFWKEVKEILGGSTKILIGLRNFDKYIPEDFVCAINEGLCSAVIVYVCLQKDSSFISRIECNRNTVKYFKHLDILLCIFVCLKRLHLSHLRFLICGRLHIQ